MKGTTKTALILALMSLVGFFAFATFGIEADRAMDKSGMGDVEAFTEYSRRAGFAFWAMVSFWVSCLVAAQLSPDPFRGRALFGFGLLQPLLLGVAYVILLSR